MALAIVLNLRDGGSKSCGLMKSWLVTRGMASSLWLIGGRTGTFAFEPLFMGYIGFVSFNSLIHLLRSQFASILGYLRVQNMSYLFMDSVQGNLILEGLKLYVCQGFYALVCRRTPTLLSNSNQFKGIFYGQLTNFNCPRTHEYWKTDSTQPAKYFKSI